MVCEDIERDAKYMEIGPLLGFRPKVGPAGMRLSVGGHKKLVLKIRSNSNGTRFWHLIYWQTTPSMLHFEAAVLCLIMDSHWPLSLQNMMIFQNSFEPWQTKHALPEHYIWYLWNVLFLVSFFISSWHFSTDLWNLHCWKFSKFKQMCKLNY